ncbi:hypothetical protein [Streptomyces sp. NPDC058664]|uniref:hypothetical protein n=1 Tax=unclassified Streptomyces TaxID=2593676 RepID=UPI00364A9FC9
MIKVWADGGYQTSVIQHGARLGIDGEVVQRPKEKGGRAGRARDRPLDRARVAADQKGR